MASKAQRSFLVGEISPRLQSRVDLNTYFSALKTARNVNPLKEGGVRNRAGTEFIMQSFTPNVPMRLFKFKNSARNQEVWASMGIRPNFTEPMSFTSTTDFSILVSANKNGVKFSSQSSITGITKANPAVVTVSDFAPSDETIVFISGVEGMTELNGQFFYSYQASGGAFKLRSLDGQLINSSSFSDYVSGGNVFVVKGFFTPLTQQQLLDADYDQIEYFYDGLVMVQKDSFPFITITGFTGGLYLEGRPLFGGNTLITSVAGTAGALNFEYAVAYVDPRTGEEGLGTPFTATSLTAPTSNSHIVNWTGPNGTYNIYTKNELGIFGLIAVVEKTGAPPYSFTYNGAVTPDTTRQPQRVNNSFENFNWPTCVSSAQQRTFLSGFPLFPRRVLCSRIGKPLNFTGQTPLTESDAFDFSLAGNKIEINNLINIGRAIILTSDGEWLADTPAITPTTINLNKESSHGSLRIRPIVAGTNGLFVEFEGDRIRDLQYSFEVDSFRGDDLTVQARHFFSGKKVVAWDYQKNPDSLVWLVMDDGSLVSMCYIPESKIVGFFRHDFGGLVYTDETKQVQAFFNHDLGAVNNILPVGTASSTKSLFARQKFIAEESMLVEEISIKIKKNTNGTGLFRVNLYGETTESTFWFDIDSQVDKTARFLFINPVELVAGQEYSIIIEGDVGPQNNILVNLNEGLINNNYEGEVFNGSSFELISVEYPGLTNRSLAFDFYGKKTVRTKPQSPRVESLVVINEDNKDVVYLSVVREIDGEIVRYVERMGPRDINEDQRYYNFLDSSVLYDGVNRRTGHTMEATGASFDAGDFVNIESSLDFFVADDVGNEIFFYDLDGKVVAKLAITAFIDAKNVTAELIWDLPSEYQASPIIDWARAVDVVVGLNHLEGESVGVYADANVIANPLDESLDVISVLDGEISLGQCYAVIRIGLPFISDVETLEIDNPDTGRLSDMNQNATRLTLHLEDTRGLYIGARKPEGIIDGLVPIQPREEEDIGEPNNLINGKVAQAIESNWEAQGRAFIRQIDPLPFTINTIIPEGFLGGEE